MKNLFWLLVCLLSSLSLFSQTAPPLAEMERQAVANKTDDGSNGYLWSKFYLWNTSTQLWDTIRRIDYSWNVNRIQTSVTYGYSNGTFDLQDSINNALFPNGTESVTYNWDGSTYSPSYYTLHQFDSLDNVTLSIIAISNNGVWDTLQFSSTQFFYSGNANYDSLLSLDLTQPIGMQKEFFVRNVWNSSGTEPDSLLFTLFNADLPSPGYANYDYNWNDYSNNRANQFIQEWDSSFQNSKRRHTFIWTSPGFTDSYVEVFSNGQFDSTQWRQQQFDAQGCQTHRDDYQYQNSAWVAGNRSYIELTYDANNRVILRETFDVDFAGTPIPFSRTEYGYPLVGAEEPLSPEFKATVFPNPSSGPISLQLELESASWMEFTIWDIQGKKLFEESWLQAPGTNTREFSTTFGSGVYSYHLKGEKGAKTGALLIR